MFEITADEIKHIDEIIIDKQAVENTLKVALTYHSNRVNELIKEEQKWWTAMSDKYGFDLAIAYVIKRENTRIVIVKKEED